MKTRRSFITLLVVLAVAGVGYLTASDSDSPMEREVEGEITAINPAAREATFEFISPRSGKRISVTGQVSPDCPITLDGRSARFENLRVGDRAKALGRVESRKGPGGLITQRVVPLKVEAFRNPTAAAGVTQAASAQEQEGGNDGGETSKPEQLGKKP